MKRALVSVTDKSGIVDFVRQLHDFGVEIISTGGTARVLRDAGIPVIGVSEVTGSPEIFGGRVKTLHPKITGGILFRRDNESDCREAEENGIDGIDLVVVNLYDFASKVAEPGVSDDDAIESIDIGGPTLIRSTAKNWKYTAILTSSSQYDAIIEELSNTRTLSDETRRKLASDAFELTAKYDSMISDWFANSGDDSKDDMPNKVTFHLNKQQSMRYGENPQQKAAFYTLAGEEGCGLSSCKQLHGKKLSFNNMIDADIALLMPYEFDEPCVSILKHTTPCGVGTGATIAEAEAFARACDPLSAFGGIIGMNRICDEQTAEQINKAFTEVIVAPGYTPEALQLLTKKKNVRILEAPSSVLAYDGFDLRRVTGGALLQQKDFGFPELKDVKVVTDREPTEEEWNALLFGWKVVKYVKSNAVLFAGVGRTLGIGAGQMSRVDAVKIATMKAEEAKLDLKGSALASDAYFPFADGLLEAVNAGATAVIQPGGSIRDQEVIDAANERNVAMVVTGRRHFRHA